MDCWKRRGVETMSLIYLLDPRLRGDDNELSVRYDRNQNMKFHELAEYFDPPSPRLPARMTCRAGGGQASF